MPDTKLRNKRVDFRIGCKRLYVARTGSRACVRNGNTLLEIMLSLAIFSSLSVVLAGSLKSSTRILCKQEENSTWSIARTTLNWIEDEIRSADRAQIISVNHLQLSQDYPASTKSIRLSGSQLLLEQAGVIQVVAEPVQNLQFIDPTGNGNAVSVTVAASDPNSLSKAMTMNRTIALDWVK